MKVPTVLSSLFLSGSLLAIGEALPSLEGKNQNGEVVKIAPKEGHEWLLIFTYPKALTPGWTNQANSVRDAFDDLKKAKVTVYGLSKDSVKTQKKFAEKNGLPFDLISDEKGEIAKALGVPVKMGGLFVSRQALLFKDGKLVWKDEDGATKTQGEEVLKVIKKEL